MNAADLLVSEGYADLGYKYVIVDDCWLSKNRSADGKLEADKTRFPNGIKALSDYVSTLIKIISWYNFQWRPPRGLGVSTDNPQKIGGYWVVETGWICTILLYLGVVKYSLNKHDAST